MIAQHGFSLLEAFQFGLYQALRGATSASDMSFSGDRAELQDPVFTHVTYILHGTNLQAGESGGEFLATGTVTLIEIVSTEHPGESALITLPTETSLADLHQASQSASSNAVNTTTTRDFFDVLMPADSPFPNLEFIGSTGRDEAIGFDGDDTFEMGGGSDTVLASLGDDTLDGGAGRDTFDAGFYTAGVNVDLIKGTFSVAGVLNGALNNIENVIGTAKNDDVSGNFSSNKLDGKAGDDTLSGDGGNDTLLGGNGDDKLSGGTGRDKLKGGDGRDTLIGGEGSDKLKGGKGVDSLYGGDGNDTLAGGKGNDHLNGGKDNDVIKGGAGRDGMYGADGEDKLIGGAGSDLLVGGEGNDTLIGGGGADYFEFGSGNRSGANDKDVIKDFELGIDELRIHGADANSTTFTSFSENGQSGTLIEFGNAEIRVLGVEVNVSDVDFY